MGFGERRAREDHFRGYEEGYGDGYRRGFDDGLKAASSTPGVPLSPLGRSGRGPKPKKRRKTAYQSAYSAAYKRLKKKHPRMSFGSLSKKAHAAARKKVK